MYNVKLRFDVVMVKVKESKSKNFEFNILERILFFQRLVLVDSRDF